MSEVHPTEHRFGDQFLEKFRLQFLSAGNWKKALADSDLPEEVTSVIGDVVQRTGLLRFEKSEITTELIHHFQDGHERGQSFHDLVRDFGKSDVAVSLFRSSKLRSRPMSVKAFRGSTIVFGGGLIGYLILQMFFHSAKPNPTVDYGAKLNESVTSMPVEQQAWPLYRDLWSKYHISNGAREGFSFDPIWFEETDRDAPEVEWFSETKSRRLIRPEDEGWQETIVFLESIEDLLATFREASKRPFLGTPLHSDRNEYSDADLAAIYPGVKRDEISKDKKSFIEEWGLEVEAVSAEADQLISSSMTGVLLPHVQVFRSVGRVFLVDTRLAMAQRDHQRAIQNVETLFGMGHQVGNSPVLVCNLVGFAISGIGMRAVEELVREHGESLSEEDLEALQRAVGVVDFAAIVDFDLTFERMIVNDMIQRIYSDDGNGNGRLTAVGTEVLRVVDRLKPMTPEEMGREKSWYEGAMVQKLTAPVNLFTAPSRKEMESLCEATFDLWSEQLQAPMWEKTDFEAYDNLKDQDSLGLLMVGVASEQIRQARESRIARQDAILLALAIHRYQRANGSWPTGLDQLTGKWIDRTPIDRISGKPLSFVVNDDDVVVYSNGHDGDDDGGKALELSWPHWLDEQGNGDWILWPSN